jgi:hypothetical protein
MRIRYATLTLALLFGSAGSHAGIRTSQQPRLVSAPAGGSLAPWFSKAADPPAVDDHKSSKKNATSAPDAAAIGAQVKGLPDPPIEPFLLTKEIGPFMILAYTFRSPTAAKEAQALVMELDADGYPAYIFAIKPNPGGVKDAAVLIGCQTEADARKLLAKVKRLRPRSIELAPGGVQGKGGLSKAMLTINPLRPAPKNAIPRQ